MGRFDYIEQRYPMRGHSYLPNDRDFGQIEIQRRKQETVETPRQWFDIVRNSVGYEVVEVNQTMIFEYEQHFSQIFKKNPTTKETKDSPTEKFMISETKILRYSASHKNEIHVSKTMKGTLWSRFNIQKPNTVASLPNQLKYSSPLTIKQEKQKDLKNLMQFISNESLKYYEQLFVGTGTGTQNPDEKSERETEYI